MRLKVVHLRCHSRQEGFSLLTQNFDGRAGPSKMIPWSAARTADLASGTVQHEQSQGRSGPLRAAIPAAPQCKFEISAPSRARSRGPIPIAKPHPTCNCSIPRSFCPGFDKFRQTTTRFCSDLETLRRSPEHPWMESMKRPWRCADQTTNQRRRIDAMRPKLAR